MLFTTVVPRHVQLTDVKMAKRNNEDPQISNENDNKRGRGDSSDNEEQEELVITPENMGQVMSEVVTELKTLQNNMK